MMNNIERLDVHPRIITTLKKAKLTSLAKILCMSAADLERTTKLSFFDVSILLKAVSYSLPCPPMRTALSLYNSTTQGQGSFKGHRLTLGCQVLDGFLRGGILRQGITEVTGESSSGKTQFCLQLCLTVQLPEERGGLGGGAVYISTEDVFPSKRLHQLTQYFVKNHASHSAAKLNFGDNIFIEHAADVDDLKNIIYHRLPVLLNRGPIKLVIIDSIAALFRVEYSFGETSKRAKVLRSFGAQLHRLSHQCGIPVVCVNQVSDVIQTANNRGSTGSHKAVIPALGMAWSSMVTVRLMLSRTEQLIQSLNDTLDNKNTSSVIKRCLRVVFAPHLLSSTCLFYINGEGVHGYQDR